MDTDELLALEYCKVHCLDIRCFPNGFVFVCRNLREDKEDPRGGQGERLLSVAVRAWIRGYPCENGCCDLRDMLKNLEIDKFVVGRV